MMRQLLVSIKLVFLFAFVMSSSSVGNADATPRNGRGERTNRLDTRQLDTRQQSRNPRPSPPAPQTSRPDSRILRDERADSPTPHYRDAQNEDAEIWETNQPARNGPTSEAQRARPRTESQGLSMPDLLSTNPQPSSTNGAAGAVGHQCLRELPADLDLSVTPAVDLENQATSFLLDFGTLRIPRGTNPCTNIYLNPNAVGGRQERQTYTCHVCVTGTLSESSLINTRRIESVSRELEDAMTSGPSNLKFEKLKFRFSTNTSRPMEMTCRSVASFDHPTLRATDFVIGLQNAGIGCTMRRDGPEATVRPRGPRTQPANTTL